jgi:DNA-binding MarR family transcriptional regulator
MVFSILFILLSVSDKFKSFFFVIVLVVTNERSENLFISKLYKSIYFNAFFEKIVLDADLGKNEYKILLYLMAKTEFEREINDTLYNIAKKINLDQGNASKAMKKLESIGIVVRNIKLRTFRLNYELAYKGEAKNYKKLQFKDPVFLEPKKEKADPALSCILWLYL